MTANRARLSVTGPWHVGTSAGHSCGMPPMHDAIVIVPQLSVGRSSAMPSKSLSKPSQNSPT
jgi:hypothetical protein